MTVSNVMFSESGRGGSSVAQVERQEFSFFLHGQYSVLALISVFVSLPVLPQ